MNYISPPAHPSGATAPVLPAELIPNHVAIVMDGNGRWAKQRGLARTEGHRRGELALIDVVAGAIEVGVKHISAYAFSTENWKRSPEEVRFLMGFNKEVLLRHRDLFNAWGVRIRWSGQRGRLWKSVIKQLEESEKETAGNDVLTLTMCVNYGGRDEIIATTKRIAEAVKAGKLDPQKITAKTFQKHLDEPGQPDVDLFWRSSGEMRTSNFLPWQSTYAELVFSDVLWPDVDRRHLWAAIEEYARRNRRFGAA